MRKGGIALRRFFGRRIASRNLPRAGRPWIQVVHHTGRRPAGLSRRWLVRFDRARRRHFDLCHTAHNLATRTTAGMATKA